MDFSASRHLLMPYPASAIQLRPNCLIRSSYVSILSISVIVILENESNRLLQVEKCRFVCVRQLLPRMSQYLSFNLKLLQTNKQAYTQRQTNNNPHKRTLALTQTDPHTHTHTFPPTH